MVEAVDNTQYKSVKDIMEETEIRVFNLTRLQVHQLRNLGVPLHKLGGPTDEDIKGVNHG